MPFPFAIGTRSIVPYTLNIALTSAGVAHFACDTKSCLRPGITNAHVTMRTSPLSTPPLHSLHFARLTDVAHQSQPDVAHPLLAAMSAELVPHHMFFVCFEALFHVHFVFSHVYKTLVVVTVCWCAAHTDQLMWAQGWWADAAAVLVDGSWARTSVSTMRLRQAHGQGGASRPVVERAEDMMQRLMPPGTSVTGLNRAACVWTIASVVCSIALPVQLCTHFD